MSKQFPPAAAHNPLQVLADLPAHRASDRIISPNKIAGILALIEQFEQSPNNKSPPGKELLFNAVKSLLHADSRALSLKWSKQQLASVLKSWLTHAMELTPPSSQRDLYVELLVDASCPKQLGHDLFLEEEDGSVATFAIVSPPRNKRTAVPRPRNFVLDEQFRPRSPVPEGPPESLAERTPSSIGTSASSAFLREIDQVARLELSPTCSTPGVNVTRISPAERPGNTPGVNFPGRRPPVLVVPRFWALRQVCAPNHTSTDTKISGTTSSNAKNIVLCLITHLPAPPRRPNP